MSEERRKRSQWLREVKALKRTTQTIKIFFIVPVFLQSATVCPVPYVEAVLPEDGGELIGIFLLERKSSVLAFFPPQKPEEVFILVEG